MYKNKFLKSTALVASIGLMVGCGSSNSNDSIGYNGVLIDTVVAGASWSCGSASGITGSNGEFGVCSDGSSVTFKIGDVVLGIVAVTADYIFTPQDISGVSRTETDDPAASVIAALLLSLDNDGNPDNGITITPEVATAFSEAVGTTTPDYATFDDDTIETIVNTTGDLAGVDLAPVPTAEAEDHLKDTAEDIDTGIIVPPTQPNQSTN